MTLIVANVGDCKSRLEEWRRVLHGTKYVKDSKRDVSSAINLSASFSIALYPFPNAEGDSETEGEGKEAKRSVEGATTMLHVHVHAESSQFERVSGLKIVARGSRVT